MAAKSQRANEEAIHGLVDTAGKLPSMHELISSAKASGPSLDWSQIAALGILLGRGARAIVPPFISRLLASYLRGRESKSIRDPWAGGGFLLLPVVLATKVMKATSIVRARTITVWRN